MSNKSSKPWLFISWSAAAIFGLLALLSIFGQTGEEGKFVPLEKLSDFESKKLLEAADKQIDDAMKDITAKHSDLLLGFAKMVKKDQNSAQNLYERLKEDTWEGTVKKLQEYHYPTSGQKTPWDSAFEKIKNNSPKAVLENYVKTSGTEIEKYNEKVAEINLKLKSESKQTKIIQYLEGIGLLIVMVALLVVSLHFRSNGKGELSATLDFSPLNEELVTIRRNCAALGSNVTGLQQHIIDKKLNASGQSASQMEYNIWKLITTTLQGDRSGGGGGGQIVAPSSCVLKEQQIDITSLAQRIAFLSDQLNVHYSGGLASKLEGLDATLGSLRTVIDTDVNKIETGISKIEQTVEEVKTHVDSQVADNSPLVQGLKKELQTVVNGIQTAELSHVVRDLLEQMRPSETIPLFEGHEGQSAPPAVVGSEDNPVVLVAEVSENVTIPVETPNKTMTYADIMLSHQKQVKNVALVLQGIESAKELPGVVSEIKKQLGDFGTRGLPEIVTGLTAEVNSVRGAVEAAKNTITAQATASTVELKGAAEDSVQLITHSANQEKGLIEERLKELVQKVDLVSEYATSLSQETGLLDSNKKQLIANTTELAQIRAQITSDAKGAATELANVKKNVLEEVQGVVTKISESSQKLEDATQKQVALSKENDVLLSKIKVNGQVVEGLEKAVELNPSRLYGQLIRDAYTGHDEILRVQAQAVLFNLQHLQLQIERNPSQESWLLDLQELAFYLVGYSQRDFGGKTAAENAKEWADAIKELCKGEFAFRIPVVGAAVSRWMDPPSGVTTVTSVIRWAILRKDPKTSDFTTLYLASIQ